MHGCDPDAPQARSRKSTGRRIIPSRRPSISSRGASIFRTDGAADRTPRPHRAARAPRRHRNQRTYDEIRRTRPVRDGPPGRRAPGLRNPDARAGAGHPPRARRARPHRRRQDRHRQDRGLLASLTRQARACEGRPRPAHARGHAHARVGSADRRGVRRHRGVHAPPHPHRGGRAFLRTPDQQAQARRGRAHRHAGTTRGPHGAEGPRASPTWRCSCSTRPTACSTWASGPP